MAGKPVPAPAAVPNPAEVLKAFKGIERKRRKPWQGEEEVRLGWIAALEKATGFDFDAERQNRDSSYNNVVIEFKGPGLFRGSLQSAKFDEVIPHTVSPSASEDSAWQIAVAGAALKLKGIEGISYTVAAIKEALQKNLGSDEMGLRKEFLELMDKVLK